MSRDRKHGDAIRTASTACDAAGELSRILEHPAIWRGRSAARLQTLPTGFPALDEGLPGGGWPRAGLIEVLPACLGVGELSLLLPALAAVTRRPEARWCAWIAPPLQPFAPALAQCGMELERVLVVQARSKDPDGKSALWAFEQTLRSGACDMVLAWLRSALPQQIRRLHLAAERGATLGVLFRPRQAAQDSSPAALRLAVEPAVQRGAKPGARITLLKSRGGARDPIELFFR